MWNLYDSASCCSFSEQQEEPKQETATLDVTAEENDESIILEENGKLMIKKGRINELFCFLPDAKRIPVDMEKIEAELEQVFSY